MSNDIAKHEPSPVPPSHALAIPESWGVGTGFGEIVTSIDERFPEGRALQLKILGNLEANAQSYINKEFLLKHVTMSPIEWPDEQTGEIIKTVRTLLVVDDNDVIDFRSSGILKSLFLLFRYEKCPPYDPPIKCTLFRQDLKNGRSMYVIRKVEQSRKGK